MKGILLLICLSIIIVGCSSQNASETKSKTNTSVSEGNIKPDKEKANQLAEKALQEWNNHEYIQAKELFEESLKYNKNQVIEEWLDSDIEDGVKQMNNAKEYSQFLEINSKINKADFTSYVSISGTIKNIGDKTITDGRVKLYYLDGLGNRIGEELCLLSSASDAQSIKPNYIGDFIAEVPDAIKANWNEQYELEVHLLEFDTDEF